MKRLLFALVLAFTLTNCNSQNFFWSYSNFAPIKYGKLYNWYVVNDSRGIAPSGWHIPTGTEILQFHRNIERTAYAYNGAFKIQETGTDHWNTVDNNATNELGFTAKGGGYRLGDTGAFIGIKNAFDMWVAPLSWGASFHIYVDSDAAGGTASNERFGFSVRLIKDDSTNTGTMTDFDGNVYPTVKIGNQVWMGQNLIVEHYNDGSVIPNVTDNTAWSNLTSGAWCHYDNDSSNQ